ncbi:MAG: alpha-hydroxy acid oxidase, partial [Haliea sp.]
MFKRNLTTCYNISDLRKRAKRRLPRAMFGYLDGFSEDGVCGRRNRSAFDRYELIPRILVNVENVDISTAVFGQKMEMPIICAPVALPRLFHHQGELAAASAAAKAGVIYTVSTLSSTPIETISKVAGPKWFQLYMYRDKGLVKELIDRAKESKYEAICLTVDAFIGGNREQDLRNGFSVPPHPGLQTILETALHPSWCWDYLTKAKVTTANIS